MQPGGIFKPKHCRARAKTAVIFPYRDRERNLLLVLLNLIPFMMAQNLEFQIFVVEQVRVLKKGSTPGIFKYDISTD